MKFYLIFTARLVRDSASFDWYQAHWFAQVLSFLRQVPWFTYWGRRVGAKGCPFQLNDQLLGYECKWVFRHLFGGGSQVLSSIALALEGHPSPWQNAIGEPYLCQWRIHGSHLECWLAWSQQLPRIYRECPLGRKCCTEQ